MKIVTDIKEWFNRKVAELYLKHRLDYYKQLPKLKPEYILIQLPASMDCTASIYTPVELVYLILQQHYSETIRYVRVTGIDVSFSEDQITVKIKTQRPGLIIGKGGRDIDLLKSKMARYFQKKVSIELSEDKTKFFRTCY